MYDPSVFPDPPRPGNGQPAEPKPDRIDKLGKTIVANNNAPTVLAMCVLVCTATGAAVVRLVKWAAG